MQTMSLYEKVNGVYRRQLSTSFLTKSIEAFTQVVT